MKNRLIGIDIGTTGTKVALFTTSGTLEASSYYTYDSSYPEIGYVEQKPQDWVDGTISGLKAVMEESGADPASIAGISFSGQMMGQVPISKDGELLLENIAIWADQRAKPQAEQLLSDLGGHKTYYDITYMGHPVHMTSTFRIMWYKEHYPEVYEKACKWLHSKEYVLYRLTGALATDPSDQCLGGAFDLEAGKHSEDILKCAGISNECFPDLYESTEVVGKITDEIATLTGLQAGTPVAVGGGDGPCAAAGSSALAEGDAYFCLGSALWGGTIESQPFGDFDSKMICYRHVVPQRYHSQYVSFTGGIGQQWFVEIAYSELAGDKAYAKALEEATALSNDESIPLFLPYLRAGGAPHHHGNASGVFHGIRLRHTRAHLYKSVVLGIAHSLQLLYEDVVRVTGRDINELTIVGGGALNPMLMQSIASSIGIPVRLLANQESNCLGAALCAGLSVGIWPSADAAKEAGIFHQNDQFNPEIENKEKLSIAYQRFQKSLEVAQSLWTLNQDLGV
ncbi:MAG: FGGY family carbohydrate kinase [Emcibacteraceae bacterium]|nr:FGGY family carbohydrate kinase [Emcibacteraceae bacterium]MDG1727126.1 FGGY family carbohydrate kinase [Emcibacteraceae bacterium]